MTTLAALTVLCWLAVALPFDIVIGRAIAYGMGSDDE
jgi:hypothetical protein